MEPNLALYIEPNSNKWYVRVTLPGNRHRPRLSLGVSKDESPDMALEVFRRNRLPEIIEELTTELESKKYTKKARVRSSELSYGAQQLWLQMLVAGSKLEPPGVFSGDTLELAKQMLPGRWFKKFVYLEWVKVNRRYLMELQRFGKVLYGNEVDSSLPAEALVCDEQYKEFKNPTVPCSGKRRKGISPSLRLRVFTRDNFSCRYCGVHLNDSKLVVDHVVPVSKGGKNNLENLVTACETCNLGKSNSDFRPPDLDQSNEANAVENEVLRPERPSLFRRKPRVG